MPEIQQHINNRGGTEFNIPAAFIAKVIGVHQGANTPSVDLIFAHGGMARSVPVLCGFAGSFFGFRHLPAPTVDTVEFGRATYGNPTSDPLAQPAFNLEQGAEFNADGTSNRDIYAVALPMSAGPLLGTTGYVVIGFLYGQVTEMQIPSDDLVAEFSDFMLIRHPADVQITIDKQANISIQHPSGARLSIGTESTLGEGPLIDRPVDLTGRDVNGRYRIRHNIDQPAGVLLRDASGSQLRMDGNGDILVSNAAGSSVHLDAFGNVTVTGVPSVTVEAAGYISVRAGGACTINAGAYCSINAAGACSISAGGIISILSATLITANAGIITLN